MPKSFNSLIQMMEVISNEQAAIDYSASVRWWNGAFCPHDSSVRVYHFSDGRNY